MKDSLVLFCEDDKSQMFFFEYNKGARKNKKIYSPDIPKLANYQVSYGSDDEGDYYGELVARDY